MKMIMLASIACFARTCNVVTIWNVVHLIDFIKKTFNNTDLCTYDTFRKKYYLLSCLLDYVAMTMSCQN